MDYKFFKPSKSLRNNNNEQNMLADNCDPIFLEMIGLSLIVGKML